MLKVKNTVFHLSNLLRISCFAACAVLFLAESDFHSLLLLYCLIISYLMSLIALLNASVKILIVVSIALLGHSAIRCSDGPLSLPVTPSTTMFAYFLSAIRFGDGPLSLHDAEIFFLVVNVLALLLLAT